MLTLVCMREHIWYDLCESFSKLWFGIIAIFVGVFVFQVGVKGNPKNVNKGLDCDVIVAEVSYGVGFWCYVSCY